MRNDSCGKLGPGYLTVRALWCRLSARICARAESLHHNFWSFAMHRVRFLAVCAALLCVFPLFVAGDATKDAEEKLKIEQEAQQYAKLYAGTVSVYLSIAEVQNGKPSIQGVKFDGMTAVGSSRFFRFTDATGTWVLEPKMIYTVKVLAK
jgi:hypothetical protein